MKKTLTELHLIMEREDLRFVASEIVKYYGMSSRVKMKRGRYKDEKGFYHWHDNTIHIDPTIRSVKEFVITVLHEIKHAMQTQDMGGSLTKWKYSHQTNGPKQLMVNMVVEQKRNPYKYVPYEIEAEKWAQKEYRKFWKNKV